MKAIILAAGVGRRLREAANGVPKCLISIGGRTLLSRHLENLAHVGIHQVVLVVGYRHQLLALSRHRSGTVSSRQQWQAVIKRLAVFDL